MNLLLPVPRLAVAAFALLMGHSVNASIRTEPLSDPYWTVTDHGGEHRGTVATRVVRLQLDQQALRQYLGGLPAADAIGDLPLNLPDAEGQLRTFRVSRSLVMAPELARRFPELQTFQGVADDGLARVRFEFGARGFSAMIFDPSGVRLIEPAGAGDEYLSYARAGREDDQPFQCLVEDAGEHVGMDEFALGLSAPQPLATGPTLRTYRTAVAATGEYTATFGGTVALGMGGIVSAINRVNQVYETDLAIRLVLVPNNHLIVYTNSSTDPYTNNSGSTMLGQNQTNLNAVIGSANYDFGHVFSTGGGGVANLNSVCSASSKARGVTGRGSPVNDPFWIDYVAHEMGHQLNAPHTFNGTTGSCSGNRSGSAAYEVGSGSTIMAYAGICGAENLQPNSDPYFHVASLNTIHNYTQSGTGSSCGTTTATGNNAPVLSANVARTIPAMTPFALSASASDPNGDPVTFLWEQFNLDPTGSTAATVNLDNGLRPLFRSFEATTSPTRIFPRLQNILANTQTVGEVMPTSNRILTFRVTARDNRSGGGGVDWNSVNVTVVNTGLGFAVTSQNAAESWAAGSSQNISWEVAGTTASPISCANVDIHWSGDGGQTFPFALASATANDGSEPITVLAQATTAGRVRVSCADNVFFDINNANITVTGGNAAPTISLPGTAVSYTSNGPAVILDSGALVSDADSADLADGALVLSLVNNGEDNDRLEVRHQGMAAGQVGVVGATVSFGGTAVAALSGGLGVVPLQLALNSNATPAAAQAILRNITYRNVGIVVGTLPRSVEARIADGDGGWSTVAGKTINITLNAPPALAYIDDGDSDNLVNLGEVLNYEVVFTKDMDSSSASIADFNNAGSAAVTINSATETTPGVFAVSVTPTSSGTLILRIPASASLLDATGLALAVPLQDDTVVSVVNTATIFADSFE